MANQCTQKGKVNTPFRQAGWAAEDARIRKKRQKNTAVCPSLTVFPYLCNMIISLSHLSVGYRREAPVVANISTDIRSGGLTCLIGDNGIGKSTLLKTLTGFLPPAGGSMTIDGQDMLLLSQRELARYVSIVLPHRPDVQNLTVAEVVGLGRTPYTGFWGSLGNHDKTVVAESIAAVGIAPLRDRMIQTLSDGELQKTMIAKALAQQTPAILLDEPTAFLDFPSKVDMFRLLNRLSKTHDKLILLSTHDLELALRYADSLIRIDHSGLQTVTPDDVKSGIEQLLTDGNKASGPQLLNETKA